LTGRDGPGHSPGIRPRPRNVPFFSGRDVSRTCSTEMSEKRRCRPLRSAPRPTLEGGGGYKATWEREFKLPWLEAGQSSAFRVTGQGSGFRVRVRDLGFGCILGL
jgi:hypothetical protein